MMVRGGDQLPFEAFRYAHVGSLAYFGFCSAHLAPDPLGFADVYALAPIHCQLHNQTLQVAASRFAWPVSNWGSLKPWPCGSI
jgi:hypothetical protein